MKVYNNRQPRAVRVVRREKGGQEGLLYLVLSFTSFKHILPNEYGMGLYATQFRENQELSILYNSMVVGPVHRES